MTNWTTNLPPPCPAAVPRAWQGQEGFAQPPQAQLPWEALGFLQGLSEQLPNFCSLWAEKCCLFHFNQAEAEGAEQSRIKLLLSVVCYWHLLHYFELFQLSIAIIYIFFPPI